MLTNKDLHPYQKKTIKAMLKSPHLGLILDMGLGKTIITLYVIKRRKELGSARRTLIIAPLFVVHNVWPQEVKKWVYPSDLTVSILHGKDKDIKFHDKTDIHLVNYEGVPWLCDKLRKEKGFPYDTLIVDESTHLKSANTSRFKKIKNLVKMFKYRYILSATTVTNSLMDVWPQWFLIDRGEEFGTAFTVFRRKYFYEQYKYHWEEFEHTRKEIKTKLAKKAIRLRAKDYLDMPKIIYNKIILELPPSMKKGYKKLEKDFSLNVDQELIEAQNSASLSIKLRQYIQGGVYTSSREGYVKLHKTKIDALKEIRDTTGYKPILVAIQFRFELDMIKEAFPKEFIPVIAGKTSVEDTKKYLKLWNVGKLSMLLVHPKAIGHGANLQSGGSEIVWVGIPWSLDLYQQFNGRLWRQGQKHTVRIHNLVMKGTKDEDIIEALIKNNARQKDILNAIRSIR